MPPAPYDNQLLATLREANDRPGMPDVARQANDRFLGCAAASGPLVFFRPAAAGGKVYGFARTAPDLFELRERLIAFLGPSYTVVPATAHSPEPGDPFEADLPAGRVVRLFAPQASVQRALEVLARMASLAERTPMPSPERSERAGSMRAFYLNLRAGDRAAAELELRRLEAVVEWTEDNLLGLRVELLAAFGAWRELLGLPELLQLTSARRTPAITRAVLRAFYQERIARHEEAGLFGLARDVFQAEVRPVVDRLLAVRTGLEDPAARRLLAYRAAVDGDDVTRAALLAEADDDERTAMAAIFATDPTPAPATPATPPADPIAAARFRYDEGEVDSAYRLAADAPPGADRAELLFYCAEVIGTLDACTLAIGAFLELPTTDRERLDRKRHLRLLRQRIEASVAAKPAVPVETPPGGWPELFERIDQPGNLDLCAIARRAADEWPIDHLSRNDIDRLIDALYKNDSGDRRRILLDLLPHLLGAVQRVREGSSVNLQALRVAVFDLLLLTHDYQPAGLKLVHDTAADLLAGGVTSDEYRQLVGGIVGVWQGDPSKGMLPWLLDAVEMVADHPSPVREERRRVLGLYAAMSPELLRELTPTDWEVLDQVAGQLDLRDMLEAARGALPPQRPAPAADAGPAADPFAALAGRTVGIYTLHESAARRAGEIIRRKCPTCEVETNADKVRTQALESMAKNCDVVVVVIRAGKHMATEPIENIRRRLDLPTVRAIGQSTSSIVRDLEHFLSDGGLG